MQRPLSWISFASLPAMLCAGGVWGCVSSGSNRANLDATLWVQTSVEYEAAVRSVYGAAARDLAALKADSGRTAALEQSGEYSSLPPAVIVDVDETILDNSPYQARLLLAGESHNSAAWSRWVVEERAEPVPGALDFVLRARELGIEVFYVTNRNSDLEMATRANLLRLGFPLPDHTDVVLTRGEEPEWVSDKTTRRQEVARTYRIVMLIGDDLNDFVAVGQRSVEERADLAAGYEAYWGDRWRMIPGPTYGSWERALFGFDYELGDDDRLDHKIDHLDPGT